MATKPAEDFIEYVYANSPGSLRNYWGERFIGSMIGLLFNTLAHGASHAIRVSKIGSSNFPDDAINLLGQERAFARFTDETAANYSTRVANAWNLWLQGGTDGGLIDMFALAGLTVTIKHNREWDWNWGGGVWGGGIWGGGDGEPDNWSRLWVIVSSHPWLSDGDWGDAGDWGDGGTWGTDATPDDVRAARQIVKALKPANAIVVAICILLDEPTWTADQTDWYDFDERSTAARYW